MKNKVFFIIVVMFVLHGMKNARQINDLAIVSSIGIDINENGEYLVTSQILNPKKENSSGSGSASSKASSDIVVYSSTSTSIQNAIRNIVEESPRRLYLAHMELLLISEAVAKQEDILDTLDYFIRDNEGSNNFMLVITKDTTPQEVMEILTPLETNPSKNIKDSIVATNKYKGISTDKTLSENIAMFLKEGQGAVLTSIEIDYNDSSLKNEESLDSMDKKENENNDENNDENKDNNSQNINKENQNTNTNGMDFENESINNSQSSQNKEETKIKTEKSSKSNEQPKIKVSYLGYFKEKSLSGYLNNDTSFMYNLLNNEAEAGIVRVGKNDDLLVTEIVSSKSKLKPKLENGEYKIDISVDMKCILSELGKNIKLETEQDVMKYQDEIANKIKEELENFIELSKNEYECDLMGFGSAYYKYNNKEYKKIKELYGENYYKYIGYNINVKVELPNEGGTYNIW